jgi:predicted MFS family arabinose efflux permease
LSAIKFVILIGIADFFADATYEGSRAIVGPFLGSLGASATAIGVVTGFGEMVGYVLRSVSGVWVNKTRRFWLFGILGYAVNMLAVPALAFASSWPAAAGLIITERTGRAIRKPAVETMLSYTADTIGRGWVFGLNTALDQAGATIGPLLVALVIFLNGGYRNAFAILLVSAIFCLITIASASLLYPHPYEFANKQETKVHSHALSMPFWLYVVAGSLVAAGFADFALVAYHFHNTAQISVTSVTLLYAMAMGTGAIASLVFGKMLDKIGFPTVLVAIVLGSLFAPFAFSNQIAFLITGSCLWGIGKGAQDSLLKAELTRLVSSANRSSAFGIYSTGFGIGWFAGSALMGWLYDHSIAALIAFSVVIQLAALPVFILANRASKRLEQLT